MAQDPILRVKPELHKKLKMAAALYDQSLYDLTNLLLAEGLERKAQADQSKPAQSTAEQAVDVVL